MIASIRGAVQYIGDDEMIVELGGLGLRLNVPLARLEVVPRPGDVVQLHTVLVVREDSLDLYGFGESDSRSLFELLLSVSGVGPRLALAALSHMSPPAFRRAVSADQPDLLTQIPGVGKKTAQKIIFELKDKLGEPGLEVAAPSGIDRDVVEVLTGLGYSLIEAQSAVSAIDEAAPEDIEVRVRQALRYFAQP